jgi:hypothetical protein
MNTSSADAAKWHQKSMHIHAGQYGITTARNKKPKLCAAGIGATFVITGFHTPSKTAFLVHFSNTNDVNSLSRIQESVRQMGLKISEFSVKVFGGWFSTKLSRDNGRAIIKWLKDHNVSGESQLFRKDVVEVSTECKSRIEARKHKVKPLAIVEPEERPRHRHEDDSQAEGRVLYRDRDYLETHYYSRIFVDAQSGETGMVDQYSLIDSREQRSACNRDDSDSKEMSRLFELMCSRDHVALPLICVYPRHPVSEQKEGKSA